eukprot:CAMPEP_0197831548 /NCGR_PEP_ID=MMETSP1437-20131217/10754_1 /TAXON_ID=49252 ORGANISM="Eucampia antarctica, Strain CCMP1452" /NCGR_SAMPLE_ID=MMETSP1437 /ASSEMBLY_ACC=CAM_ASM_001096 /LENGTH=299 /DNA_ID=CAMNT_0043434505 /DNA_START=179 /DNA_END=1075 /DNA_ORIENTATION=+
MSDHMEEQEMEAEALEAIFDTSFEVISSIQPFEWSLKVVPIDCGDDEEEENAQNHVAVKLMATIPKDYPESLPQLDIIVLKGLAEEQRQTVLRIANDESKSNEGMPAIYAICEAVRTWLGDNNVKGLDDGSMHAQMMRRAREEAKSKEKLELQFESQKKEDEMTSTELEEIEVRKRRTEGTPCNEENFLAWREKFNKETEDDLAREADAIGKDKSSTSKKKGGANTAIKDEAIENRLTGFQQFSGKMGVLNMEDIEKAADEAENDPNNLDVEELNLDEDLFDDDEDLDDLDFDDDDDEE